MIVLLSAKFDGWFAAITFGALVLYIAFTVTRDRVAHGVPARDERAGLEGQHQGARRAAQLRDGQVLLQRAVRAGALRREPAAAREGVDQVADLAVAAQPRPEPDHRDGGDAAGLARDRRRRRRHDDARRPGARQRADDPALHPAQLPRRDLPRDQAVDDRHGEDVRAARPEPRDRRRARRARRSSPRGGAVRFERRALRLRRRPRDPARRQLRDPGRQDGRRGRARRARARARWRGCCSASTTSTAGRIAIDGQDIRERDAEEPARGDRHRAAGHGAVQRHGRIQHRLRPHRRRPRRGRGGGARGAHPRLHRLDAEGLRHDGRRARPEALGRREAARRDRAHAAQEPADPDLRRGDLGARLGQRAGDPGRAAERGAQPHRARHRAPAVDGRRRAPDPGHGAGPDRRARHATPSWSRAAAATPRCGSCSRAAAKRVEA